MNSNDKQYMIMTDIYNSISNPTKTGRLWFIGFSQDMLQYNKSIDNVCNPCFVEKLRITDLDSYSYPLEESKKKLKLAIRYKSEYKPFLLKITKVQSLLKIQKSINS